MARYLSKPVEIEAEQWFPPGDQRFKPIDGVKSGAGNISEFMAGRRKFYVITIHEQPTEVAPGDWIITEPDGIHHYPCKPDIFEKRYEPAAEMATQ